MRHVHRNEWGPTCSAVSSYFYPSMVGGGSPFIPMKLLRCAGSQKKFALSLTHSHDNDLENNFDCRYTGCYEHKLTMRKQSLYLHQILLE